MIKRIAILIVSGGVLLARTQAATPDQEKAFVNAYRKALEAGDKETLAGFLYTEGAQPEQIEFFKAMQTLDPGAKITSIELATPSADDMAKLNRPLLMPDGKSYVMAVKPFKQLVIVSELKDANGSSKSTTRSPVAEVKGKLVIPVPVPVPDVKKKSEVGGEKKSEVSRKK
jgi:hypothetical protein